MITFLLNQFESNLKNDALVWQDRAYSYGDLLDLIRSHQSSLANHNIRPGSIVSLEADFSPSSVAMLLALIDNRNVIVPLTDSVKDKRDEFREIANVEYVVEIKANDDVSFQGTGHKVDHQLLQELQGRNHPGLILFSSGSTGKSKAAVHDLVPLLEKFKVPRKSKRILTFLLFDHIGGFNTIMYSLSNGGCAITVSDRTPEHVCAAIEKCKAEILPTSPTFLNLLLLSESYKDKDFSSLELVTYGTEMMPESTLTRFRAAFPQVTMQQTYGLSEVGILRSKSESSDSLWVKIGGEGYETRIRDGMLEIKAKAAMMGYLNAPSPFTEDGWFKTGDVVEVKGDFFRFLGRKSEIINIGGEKVYPAEVEGALQEMDGVLDVAVAGEPHAIMGHIVTARVRLNSEETQKEFRVRMKKFLKDKLPAYKIPQKIILEDHSFHGGRFKKMRGQSASGHN